jgi:hypothetical protein
MCRKKTSHLKKRSLSAAQLDLIDELRAGYVIYEKQARARERFSYITAQIDNVAPFAFLSPRRVNKQTVFALLSLGLLEEFRPWHEYETVALRLDETKDVPE